MLYNGQPNNYIVYISPILNIILCKTIIGMTVRADPALSHML